MSRSYHHGSQWKMKPWNEDHPYWKYFYWSEHGPKEDRQTITRRNRHKNKIILKKGGLLIPFKRNASWEWW
jgi:hypothetical protein